MALSVGLITLLALLVPASAFLFSRLIPAASRIGLLDRPGGRHIHARPVPLVGGLGVALTWLAGVVLLTLIQPHWASRQVTSILVTSGCALATLALGLADDRNGLSPRSRLLAELAVAVVTVAFEPSTHQFCRELAPWLGWSAFPLTAVGIAGVVNAMNLVDGMDGLAGGMFLSMASAIAYLGGAFAWGGVSDTPSFGAVSALLLVPGLIAFLRVNWNPARTFMGDHGSLTIGYLLAVSSLSLRTTGPLHSPVDIVGLAILFSYPVLDMTLCLVRRARSGQPLFVGDRNHMHHRMLRLGLTTRDSAKSLLSWQLAMISPVLLIREADPRAALLLLLPPLGVALERLHLINRIEWSRVVTLRNRALSLAPQPLAKSEWIVRAEVVVSLRPLYEAAQYEERGKLDPLIDSLRCFCERRARPGKVRLAFDDLIVELPECPSTDDAIEELRADWVGALGLFSQAFQLTYSTFSLPVTIHAYGKPVAQPVPDAAADKASARSA